jgi:hypothetical protein
LKILKARAEMFVLMATICIDLLPAHKDRIKGMSLIDVDGWKKIFDDLEDEMFKKYGDRIEEIAERIYPAPAATMDDVNMLRVEMYKFIKRDEENSDKIDEALKEALARLNHIHSTLSGAPHLNLVSTDEVDN